MDKIGPSSVSTSLINRLMGLGAHRIEYDVNETTITFGQGLKITVAHNNPLHHDMADYISKCLKVHDIL